MPIGSAMAPSATGAMPSDGATALTLATAKFAYLNSASVPRLATTAAASQRRRAAGRSAPPIASPKPQFASTEATTSATYGPSPQA